MIPNDTVYLSANQIGDDRPLINANTKAVIGHGFCLYSTVAVSDAIYVDIRVSAGVQWAYGPWRYWEPYYY